MNYDLVKCLIDGKPSPTWEASPDLLFVGMEQEPGREPRYGRLLHPWYNKLCYETRKKDGGAQ
jgi:hypothetical protein